MKNLTSQNTFLTNVFSNGKHKKQQTKENAEPNAQ